MAEIYIGSSVIIKEGCVIKPSITKTKSKLGYQKIKISDHVMIEENSVISAHNIGNFVHIGKNCIIKDRCNIKDNVKILDNSVLETDTNIPPFSVFGGKPAVYLGSLTESFSITMKNLTLNYYTKFCPVKSKKRLVTT